MAIDFAKADEGIRLDVVYVAPIPALSEEDQQKYAELLDHADEGLPATSCTRRRDQLDGLEGRYETFLVKGSDPAAELLKLIDAPRLLPWLSSAAAA